MFVVAGVGMGIASGASAVGSKGLVGKMWLLQSLAKKPPVSGTSITMAFGDGAVSGSAGCNSYRAPYKAGVTSLRISGPIAATHRSCKPAVDAQEAAFMKMLVSARRYSIRGNTLTLRGGSRDLATFQAQSQELAGTAWNAVSYNNGKQAVVSVMAGTKLTAVFDTASNVSGSAGCNSYSGSVSAKAPSITIGPLSATRKACASPAGVMEQESEFLTALESSATYSVQGGKLELRTKDGAIAVEFARR
jgi:heat shock protein HslJ